MAGVREELLVQPGVLHTLTGGTRTKVNLNRPWQQLLPYDPEHCPFCTKTEDEVMNSLPEWRVLGNTATPHEFHRLIIPRKCPTRERTYILGGPTAIEQALTIYGAAISVAAQMKDTRERAARRTSVRTPGKILAICTGT
jgi:hypothetical protein